MAFVSYTYNGCDPATKQSFYTLVDSDFGEVEVVAGVGSMVASAAGIVREYIKRGLNVGKNLALLVLYMHKERGHSISDLKYWQDEYCPKHIENWDMYAKERDEHLTKLLALL